MFSREGEPIRCTRLVEGNAELVIGIIVAVFGEIVGCEISRESFHVVHSPNSGVVTVLRI